MNSSGLKIKGNNLDITLLVAPNITTTLRPAERGDDQQRKIRTRLVGAIPTPMKNMSSSVGMMTFPIYGKIKNDPNHQPGDYWGKVKNVPNHQPGDYWVLQVLLMKRPQPRGMTNRFWSCADQTDWDAPSSIFGVSCPEKNNPYGTTVRSYCVVAQHSEYESPNLEENAIWLECILWYCVHWFDFPCSKLSFRKNVYSKYLSTTLHGITFQKSMVNLCYGSPQKIVIFKIFCWLCSWFWVKYNNSLTWIKAIWGWFTQMIFLFFSPNLQIKTMNTTSKKMKWTNNENPFCMMVIY